MRRGEHESPTDARWERRPGFVVDETQLSLDTTNMTCPENRRNFAICSPP